MEFESVIVSFIMVMLVTVLFRFMEQRPTRIYVHACTGYNDIRQSSPESAVFEWSDDDDDDENEDGGAETLSETEQTPDDAIGDTPPAPLPATHAAAPDE